MAEYVVDGKTIELDNSKTYLDFFRQDRKGQLVEIDLELMLTAIQSGELAVDDSLKEHMKYLKRWEIDAPRKRNLREMRRSGVTVATTDALFEQDGGEEIIDNLENTGVFAAYFLKEVYGIK